MSEVALFPWWLSLIFAAWAAIGPLIGIFVGSYLTRRWQHEQWLLDNKKEEYRELLSSLTQAFHASVEFYSALITNTVVVRSGSEEVEYDDIMTTALTTANDRLFIRRQMKEIDLADRWQDLVKGLSSSEEALMLFAKTFNGIRQDIVNCAMKIAG